MKLDVLYEVDVPKPWPGPHPWGQRQAEQQAYKEALEQIRLADKLGFHTTWHVEHAGERSSPSGLDRPRGRGQSVLVAVAHGHVGAVRGEGARDRGADALRRAGHDGVAACERRRRGIDGHGPHYETHVEDPAQVRAACRWGLIEGPLDTIG